MSSAERVRELAQPIAAELEVELVDVEFSGGVMRVTIDRDGGLDIDVISRVSRALSRAVDETDPVPGRYTLEVSSPGLERPLRTPEHFRRAIGSLVLVKTLPEVDGDRRAKGTLTAADDQGIVVRDPETLTDRAVGYDQISTARTVFEWGPSPKPGAGRNQRKKASSR